METIHKREAWNKGKLVGQKPPLKPKDIWAIRIFLQNGGVGLA
ncbi:MAG: integrase [Rhodocyclaceae bacterium]|nr:integrase [Rhodocyclaceae bacterium]